MSSLPLPAPARSLFAIGQQSRPGLSTWGSPRPRIPTQSLNWVLLHPYVKEEVFFLIIQPLSPPPHRKERDTLFRQAY